MLPYFGAHDQLSQLRSSHLVPRMASPATRSASWTHAQHAVDTYAACWGHICSMLGTHVQRGMGTCAVATSTRRRSFRRWMWLTRPRPLAAPRRPTRPRRLSPRPSCFRARPIHRAAKPARAALRISWSCNARLRHSVVLGEERISWSSHSAAWASVQAGGEFDVEEGIALPALELRTVPRLWMSHRHTF